jgi:hypothetical protein
MSDTDPKNILEVLPCSNTRKNPKKSVKKLLDRPSQDPPQENARKSCPDDPPQAKPGIRQGICRLRTCQKRGKNKGTRESSPSPFACPKGIAAPSSGLRGP